MRLLVIVVLVPVIFLTTGCGRNEDFGDYVCEPGVFSWPVASLQDIDGVYRHGQVTRITTHDGFRQSMELLGYSESRREYLNTRFTSELFEERQLLFVSWEEPANTTGVSINSISDDGVINATRAQWRIRRGEGIVDIALLFERMVEICQTIQPSSWTVNTQTVRVSRP